MSADGRADQGPKSPMEAEEVFVDVSLLIKDFRPEKYIEALKIIKDAELRLKGEKELRL